MKKLMLLAVGLAMAATARAQVVAHYAEVYEDRPNGPLKYKMWVAADGNMRQELSENGTIQIFRRDSMMLYRLDPAKKTAMVIPFSQVEDPNKLFGAEIQKSNRNTKSEMLGVENVEGYETEHWRYEYETVLANGGKQIAVNHAWIYKPLNTWIRDAWDEFARTDRQVKRNIVQGPQPASLFEIPRDYKRTSLPGGLMERLGGGENPGDALRKRIEEANRNPPQRSNEEAQRQERLREEIRAFEEQLKQGNTTKTQEQLRQEQLREQIRRQGGAGEE